MAEFCSQCSVEHFGEDFGDFKDLCDEKHFAFALCEGCGFIQVDHEGRCVSENCDEQGHKGSSQGTTPSVDRLLFRPDLL